MLEGELLKEVEIPKVFIPFNGSYAHKSHFVNFVLGRVLFFLVLLCLLCFYLGIWGVEMQGEVKQYISTLLPKLHKHVSENEKFRERNSGNLTG